MEKKKVFSFILAIAGTVLVWLPVLLMVVTGIAGSISAHEIQVDYMLPAELGFLVIAGAATLLWAAIRERSYIKPIAISAGLALLMIVGCTSVASLSGLASGRVTEAQAPWAMNLSMGLLFAYDLMVIMLGLFGLMLAISIRFLAKHK